MKTYHPSHIFYNWSNLLRSYATRDTLLHSLHHFVQASSAFGGSTLTPRRGAFRWTCERVSRFFSYHFFLLSLYLPSLGLQQHSARPSLFSSTFVSATKYLAFYDVLSSALSFSIRSFANWHTVFLLSFGTSVKWYCVYRVIVGL